MPMDRRITQPVVSPQEARAGFGLDPERRTLLVSGGSQGALAINSALTEARDGILADGIQILHVLGPRNFDGDAEIVHPSGAVYKPVAFVQDMAAAYAAADLMVGRAGAGTVMETAVSGLPVVFVPLPWGNGEQAKNATALVEAGGGVLLEESALTADSLGSTVTQLFAAAPKLEEMARIARTMYPADAAEKLARAVLDAAGKDPA